MTKTNRQLAETHIDGPRSRLRVVTAGDCPALRAHHIAHAGIVAAKSWPQQSARIAGRSSRCVI
jgi:hypothetical protein